MRKQLRLIILGLWSLGTSTVVQAKSIRALFVGNSYTESNNLPEIIHQLALSAGDTLIYEKSTPGGTTLRQHSTNTTTLNLIQQGNWDYVVLQEQSQLPSFPESQVVNQVYPYAKQLDSLIKVYNPCAATVFYMTWGRKNGDASNCPNFPVVCTYLGMDSMIQLRYTQMAQTNNAVLSPVAKVWRSIIDQYPNINLYTGDESHPSYDGSLAAAASFYSIFFQKDPTLTTYTGNSPNASIIKETAKNIVFDSLSLWYQNTALPLINFTSSISNYTVSFTNISSNFDTYEWNFGDGNNSTQTNPSHTYSAPGSYTVTLTGKALHCDKINSKSELIFLEEAPISTSKLPLLSTSLYPNPVMEQINMVMAATGKYEVSIIDISGRTLSTTMEHGALLTINTQHIKPGFYTLRIRTEHNVSQYLPFQKL